MNTVKNNLLYITTGYCNFLKDPCDILAKSFHNVYATILYYPLFDLLSYLPFTSLNSCRKKNIIDTSFSPSNINFFYSPIYFYSGIFRYEKAGQVHFKSVDKLISSNKLSFDIIHSQFIWSSGYAGTLIKQKYNKPLVITAHGYDVYDLPFRNDNWRKIIKYVLNSADYIIAVSNKNRKILNELDIKTPIKVIPNGYRNDLFFPMDKNICRTQLGIPLNNKILLTVGSLDENKGQKYLIEALNILSKNRSDFICYIIGEGNLRGKLIQQINDLKLNNKVKLMGWMDHNKIPFWMNASDLFILPSIRESFGVVQIEAMACGKPIVATMNGGSEEILISNDYGYLVSPGNSLELAGSISKALDKKWNNELIIKYAERYAWKFISKEILNVYNNFI